MNPVTRSLDLLSRVAAGDPACADEVERMGRELLDLADRLRSGMSEPCDCRDWPFGIGDPIGDGFRVPRLKCPECNGTGYRKPKDPYTSTASFSDSAALTVVGPDGTVKQQVDTRSRP